MHRGEKARQRPAAHGTGGNQYKQRCSYEKMEKTAPSSGTTVQAAGGA